jgi:AraC-like DNA-binding protein
MRPDTLAVDLQQAGIPGTRRARFATGPLPAARRSSIRISHDERTVNPPRSIDQPGVTVVEITDPTDANAGIELLDIDAVQLQSTPFLARRVTVRLETSAVVYHSTNLRLRTRTRIRKGLLAYVAFGASARGSVNGLPVRPGLMLAVEPDTEAAIVTDTGWESVNFLLAPAQVSAHLAERRRAREFHLPNGVEALQVDPGQVRRLFDWGKRLAQTGARAPALFAMKEERLAAEADLLETLLVALRGACDLAPTRSDLTRQAQSRIVKAAEAYALANAESRLYVTDLCRAAAVSERTLEYAFKEVLGMTPMAYLVRLRLHRARRALLAATPRSTTVSAEALNWGFWHFGEFSRAYKACFGEAPSETLRRKAVEPRR